ncbi:hypothetical protein OF830_13740 [Bacillus paramycoides]|uniref:hypothetical protein n=1 Tax=Bacillus paramycoides TaxID=2026194 RepID=UPI002244D3C3|nr:hypothetical protein [Bacillus paramycoides]MCW9132017.1 hypothetical protein [Bacillus paramycoides]
MNLWLDILTYGTCIIAAVGVVIAVRYRNYIDWFYLIFLLGMAVSGISSVKKHFPLGMIIADTFAVIALFCTIRQAKKRISSKTTF